MLADQPTRDDPCLGPASPVALVTVELRDVAVGAALLLRDRNPADCGFEAFRELADPTRTLREKLRVSSFAFVSPAAREAAHKKAREWLAN